uniref:G_PROTEIN_RECEP_F1_2 domain-containing protein n=2 Tax=Bursaphelenchus xylophilus TaxID=6326 RepID=A0A1I7SJ69_BURXY
NFFNLLLLSFPSKILFYILQDYRTQLYYIFGVTCLLSWLAFNLYILRDYFFPCWFDTVYTEDGLNKEELEQAKMNYMVRQKVSSAMAIPTSVCAPVDLKKNMFNKGHQRSHSVINIHDIVVKK